MMIGEAKAMIRKSPLLKTLQVTALCTSLAWVTACTPIELGIIGSAAYNVFYDPDVNLTQKSYAAADYLHQQSKTFYDRWSEFKVLPLKNTDAPDLETDLGKEISHQVGSRFSQLGYTMDLSDVQQTKIGNVAIGSYKAAKPEMVLDGYYTIKGRDVKTHLRITDVSNGRVVSSFEYNVPKTYEMERMNTPNIKIMRTSQTPQTPQNPQNP
jgi:hypothetical protein